MKPELTLLAWSVVLAIVHMLATVQALVSQKGLMTAFGNRENLPELAGWGGRAQRANTNMARNLVLFAAVVLAVMVAVQWFRRDEQETRRKDRQADRDGDAELKAYNAHLAKLRDEAEHR